MLNESKGNMYDWVTHTWNPIKGKCSHNCNYCFMKKMLRDKMPNLRLEESEFKDRSWNGQRHIRRLKYR